MKLSVQEQCWLDQCETPEHRKDFLSRIKAQRKAAKPKMFKTFMKPFDTVDLEKRATAIGVKIKIVDLGLPYHLNPDGSVVVVVKCTDGQAVLLGV